MSEGQINENQENKTPETAPIVKKPVPVKLIAVAIALVVLLAVVLFFIAKPLSSVQAPAATPALVKVLMYDVTGDRVHLRGTPSYQGVILGHVNKGDCVEHGAEPANVQDPWIKVTVQGQSLSGWVHKDFLKTKQK